MNHSLASTLFVSDLDGTLLRKDATLSEHTIQTLHQLIEEGMAFTYATARSIQSARRVTAGLRLNLPVITRNGSVFADQETEAILEKAIFSKEDVSLLKSLLPELPHCGFVSSYIGDEMIKTYCDGELSVGLQEYVADHANDHRMQVTADPNALFGEQSGYVTMIDDYEKLAPTYERVRSYSNWECVFQKDTYGEAYWLEFCPKNSTKAKALLKLKERLGFEKLVVFGDSVNDVSMFEIADKAYAVSNAMDELKQIATAVIGSNEEDTVANTLQKFRDAAVTNTLQNIRNMANKI